MLNGSKHFSKVMDPLFSALTSKSLPLLDDALEAIRLVKKSIHEAVLHVVDPNKPLSLFTDASKSAIGAILSQEGQPVAFMFKCLSAAQQRWSPVELEGFVVVSVCQEFRHYIANRPFNILCDQHGFVQALNSSSNKGIKNAKFAHWRIELTEFDFTIQHLPGILNTAADTDLLLQISSVSSDSSFELAHLRHNQYRHPGIFRLVQLLCSANEAHAIHNLEEVCCKVVTSCQICAEIKPHWISPPAKHVVSSTGPWQRISIDFMIKKPTSSEGFMNIFTVIDEYSRFPFAFPMKDWSTSSVIKCLSVLFTLFGPPKSIHSDRGAEFFLWSFPHFSPAGVCTRAGLHPIIHTEMGKQNVLTGSSGRQFNAYWLNANCLHQLDHLF